MKVWISLGVLILVLGLAAAWQFAGGQTEMMLDDGMLIHITHAYDDPHRVLMALQMARIISADKKVLVYLDIEAVKFVLKDAKDITHTAFPTAQTQIKYLLDHDVTIMACPGCLAAAGKSAEDLMPGIEVANKANFFSFANGRIITLDY